MTKRNKKDRILKGTANIFISYSVLDEDKLRLLESVIRTNDRLTPIIISDKKESLKELSDKVIEGIKSSDYIIPILTSNSISTQWINQEIGFSKALGDEIKIMPIVERKLLDDLKGFIHKGVDLPYLFIDEKDELNNKAGFREISEILIGDILSCLDKNKGKIQRPQNLEGLFY